MRYSGTCPYLSCGASGWADYGGLCGKHWADLSPEKRSVLLGHETPIERIIRQTVIPARSRTATAALWLWRIGVTGAVGWMLWRQHQ